MRVELTAQVEVLENRANTLEETVKRLEDVIEKIRDRLPLWATWTMTFGGMIIGALVTFLATCMK